MFNEKLLFIALVIIFLIVLFNAIKAGSKKEQFLTCYNFCKGKDQWNCGRQCDFIHTLYGGNNMTSVQDRLGYFYGY